MFTAKSPNENAAKTTRRSDHDIFLWDHEIVTDKQVYKCSNEKLLPDGVDTRERFSASQT